MVFVVPAIGYIAAGFASNIPTLAFTVLFINTGIALARPTFMAALSAKVPQKRRGVVTGAIQSRVAVTDIASPVVAGFILGLGLTEDGAGRWWRSRGPERSSHTRATPMIPRQWNHELKPMSL